MESTNVWTSKVEDSVNILWVTPTHVVRMATEPRRVSGVLALVQQGAMPTLPKDAQQVPLNAVRSIEYSVAGTFNAGVLTVRYAERGGTKAIVFGAGSTQRAKEVGHALATAVGFVDRPKLKSASFAAVSAVPVALIVVFGLMFAFLYMGAAAPESDDSQPVRVGKARAMRNIGKALGPGGVLLVALGVLGSIAAYWVFRAVKRPQLAVFERSNRAKVPL